ncbi:plasmid recombination protein [Halomonas sp. A40-4]|uniref:plasmid recombination protein n=1 Tax=Halomonas sp. A40-4 TaxID=2785909 RepID=UPI0018EFFDA7|nr:plasmid recombination protein [Halomonas sp. A40-4]QPL46481.1 plasmid recombination protein [Halomonas sp. A40-4]
MTKLKSWSAVATSGGHTWRTLPVPHADPDKQHLNEDWRDVASPAALRDAIGGRLALVTATTAKSPVLCVEYLITARAESFKEQGGETDAPAYFRDAQAFLEARHGAANVVAVNVQNDESAPHLVVYVVPLVERPARTIRKSVFAGGRDENGKLKRVTKQIHQPAEVVLSADHYNGTPAKLSSLQTAFAEEVATKHRLARGLELSAASHTTNKQHHEALARALAGHIDLTAAELERRGRLWSKETPEEQAARLSELIRDHYAPVIACAASAVHDRRRANEMEETARRHQERYKAAARELAAFTEGLSDAQQSEVKQAASQLRRESEERKRWEAEQARQQREEAEREQKREALRERERLERRERALVERLKSASPLAFAGANEATRRECWGLLASRDDLAQAFELMSASPYFDSAGHLTDVGHRAVLSATDPAAGKPPGPRERSEATLQNTPPTGPKGPNM